MYELPPLYQPLCVFCKHFHIVEESHLAHALKKPSCKAFSDGIPLEIWQLIYDHREPHPDDTGIQFEPAESFQNLRESLLGRHIYGKEDVSPEEIRRWSAIMINHATRNMELRRMVGTAYPPLSENDERAKPRDKEELKKIIAYRISKEVNEYDIAQGENLTRLGRALFELKTRLRLDLEYGLPEVEATYIEKNYAFEKRVETDSCVVEVYRSLNREERLIEIYREFNRLDQLRWAYENLGLKPPIDLGDT